MCHRYFTEHCDEKGKAILLMAKKTYSGIIDRFEGDYAVILIGPEQEETLDVRRSLLPEETEEGDIVSFSLSVKKNKTAKAKKEVSDMIEKLKKGSSK